MESRATRINKIVGTLLEKRAVLNQYALWLETSEEHTYHQGKDIYDMLLGSMLAIDGDPDFIPGVGWRNYVEVVKGLQDKTGLDLGVCQFLELSPPDSCIDSCNAKEKLSLVGLSECIPPRRAACKYRILKLQHDFKASTLIT